jgi:hypothetical protein
MDVRVCDGIAAAGDATVLRPRLDAPANALALPSPSPAEFGIRQLGATTGLGAEPVERCFIVDGADRLDIAIVFWSHIGHSSQDVHPSKVYTVGPIRCLSLASGDAGLVPDAALFSSPTIACRISGIQHEHRISPQFAPPKTVCETTGTR